MSSPSFRAGDVLFVRGKSLISKLIKKIDNGSFSHVVIAVSEKSVLESQRFVKSSIVPIYFDDYEVVDLGLTDEERDKVVHLAVDLVGKHYDYIQVFNILLKKWFGKEIKNNPNNVICSELIVYILFKLNWFENVSDADKFLKLTPNELYKYLTKIV